MKKIVTNTPSQRICEILAQLFSFFCFIEAWYDICLIEGHISLPYKSRNVPRDASYKWKGWLKARLIFHIRTGKLMRCQRNIFDVDKKENLLTMYFMFMFALWTVKKQLMMLTRTMTDISVRSLAPAGRH